MLRDPEHLLQGAVGHGAHGGRSLLIAFPPSASRVYSEPKRAAAEDPASTRPCHHCRKTRFPENADQKPSRTQRPWLTRGPTRDTGRCTCLPLQPKQHKSDQHVEDARCIVHSSQDPSQSISLPRLPPFGSLLTHQEVAQPRVVSVGVGSKLCLDDVGEALRLFESRYQSPCLLVIKHRFSLWACAFLGCWLVSVLINGICVCGFLDSTDQLFLVCHLRQRLLQAAQDGKFFALWQHERWYRAFAEARELCHLLEVLHDRPCQVKRVSARGRSVMLACAKRTVRVLDQLWINIDCHVVYASSFDVPLLVQLVIDLVLHDHAQ